MSPLPNTLARAAISCLLVLGCSEEAQRPPNVVLITLDTVRADRIGCYGGEGLATPRIDRLAAEADRYASSQSTASWTVPSHASLFTGRFPFQHGAHSFPPRDQNRENVRPLGLEQVTLAEVLAREGYRTGAFAANDAYLGKRLGLDQGFEAYEVERVPGSELNVRAFAWLEAAPERPFFLFLNYMDAHRPYNTAPLETALPTPLPDDNGRLLLQLKRKVMGTDEPLPEKLRDAVLAQYDYGIAHCDAAVGEVVDWLRARGLYDETLLIVTSDHGEYLGEHRLVEHSKDIYQEGLAVPLLVKRPAQTEGEVIATRVCSADVPGLISEALPEAQRRTVGRLFPYRPGNHVVLGENYYSRMFDYFHETWGHRFRRVRLAIFDGRWKYIHSTDDAHELYDLEADPRESRNLVEENRGVARALALRLSEFIESGGRYEGADEGLELSEEDRAALRELGYLGEDG